MPNDSHLTREDDRAAKIRHRINEIRIALNSGDAISATRTYPECVEAVARIKNKLAEFESSLGDIPPIDVVVLGPSRHGKSTLLNSLVQTELLPTSDVKPCTASILTLNYAPEWSVHVQFVNREQFQGELREALRNAQEALQPSGEDEVSAEEPRFNKSDLQRFIQLFRVDSDLPPDQLLAAVQNAKIPAEADQWLGKNMEVKADNINEMRSVVAKYLSTEDVFWTIVEHCNIFGPFPEWHPSLRLVDLPGTNDTDPHRTAITNSKRENATAVAIVTSESNLGPDIESWLRNSSVLANFLEATDKLGQRLFIIRTKLDSYHPNTNRDRVGELSDNEENQIHRKAVESYKAEQTSTFLAMLRNIAGPKLPSGRDDVSRSRRAELLARIGNIRVFFVSALAHEVFSDRFSTTRKTECSLYDYFDEDIKATGVPALRTFLTDVASTYLSENFYDDLESKIESEVGLLASSFQKIRAATLAELVPGGNKSLQEIDTRVKDELIPWLNREVAEKSEQFRLQTNIGATGIMDRLKQVEGISERRIQDKVTSWSRLHWASLRSVARKGGIHVTSRGENIDINEDICSVLIDDVVLAWTDFRDRSISKGIENIMIGLSAEIERRLHELQQGHSIPEVAEAVLQISCQLLNITNQQRFELLAQVNKQVAKVESIRRPAYQISQEEMRPVLADLSHESGPGCYDRMQKKIRQGAPGAIKKVRTRVNALIEDVVSGLASTCTRAITTFGNSASDRIHSAISHTSSSLVERDRPLLENRVRVIDNALKLLPGPEGAI